MTEVLTKKILLVDDEEEILTQVGAILERANYEVICASSGFEAIDLAKEKRPDLIILDIILPDIDGGEVAYRLSQEPATADIPIVFLTGILKKGEEHLVKKTGNRYVLAKPVNAEEFLGMLKILLPS